MLHFSALRCVKSNALKSSFPLQILQKKRYSFNGHYFLPIYAKDAKFYTYSKSEGKIEKNAGQKRAVFLE